MTPLSVTWDGTSLLTARPIGPPPAPRPALDPEAVCRLSRFALVRRDAAEILLESPAAPARVILHDRRLLLLLHDLAEPLRERDLAARTPELPAPAIGAVLDLLHRLGLVVAPPFDEDTASGPAMWSFHDRLFHARTRRGTSPDVLGKTYPFRGLFSAPPAIAPPSGQERLALPRPDLARLTERDPPFAAVVEARRSTRVHGAAPISIEALGELLFRTLRVRSLSAPTAARDYEHTDRPLPSAGSCHALEAYFAVDRCAGLAAGLYRYAPDAHALDRVSEKSAGVDRLLDDAAHAAAAPSRPQVLLILAARACAEDTAAALLREGVVDLRVALRTLTARLGARVIFDAEIEGSGAPEERPERAGVIAFAEAFGEDFAVVAHDEAIAPITMIRPRAPRRMDTTLALLDARIQSREDRGDVLSFLVRAAPDGAALSRDELAGELLQMLYAGHLTVPAVLMRLFQILAEAPGEAARARADEAHLGRLLQETMRLHPPAPILYRQVAEPFALEGHELPRGAAVWICPPLLHHDPRWFPEPGVFRPARFEPGALAQIPEYAYLPFGAGPRTCAGRRLALLLMGLVAATILRRATLVPRGGDSFEAVAPP